MNSVSNSALKVSSGAVNTQRFCVDIFYVPYIKIK